MPPKRVMVAQKGMSKKGMILGKLPKPPKMRERAPPKRMWGKMWVNQTALRKLLLLLQQQMCLLDRNLGIGSLLVRLKTLKRFRIWLGKFRPFLMLKPAAKAVKVKRVLPSQGPTGLLDGGATNALRRGSPKELAESDDVLVELAHGSVELKQHPLTGTILTEHGFCHEMGCTRM